MARDKYLLADDEYVILKESCVRHGFWAAYTDELVLTSKNILLIKYGLFNNYKETKKFPLDDIVKVNGKPQVIIGEASNGEKQLEVYTKTGMEDFAFQSGDKKTLKTWLMAIQDRFSDMNDSYDHNYYQQFIDDSNYESNSNSKTIQSSISQDVSSREIVDGLLSTGLLPKGVAKSIKKSQKQAKKNGFLNDVMDAIGVNELVDDFKDDLTEVRNEFREGFGMKPIMTKRALKEQQERIEEEERNKAFQQKVNKAREEAAAKNKKSENKTSFTIDEQILLLKKLKELLDEGIITQEEFEQKKKEIF